MVVPIPIAATVGVEYILEPEIIQSESAPPAAADQLNTPLPPVDKIWPDKPSAEGH